MPLALTNVCFEEKNRYDAGVTPFPLMTQSGLQRMSRLPRWRNKWVGFYCAAIFRQTLIQSVEGRANSDPEGFGLLLRHPRRQMHWLHEVLL